MGRFLFAAAVCLAVCSFLPACGGSGGGGGGGGGAAIQRKAYFDVYSMIHDSQVNGISVSLSAFNSGLVNFPGGKFNNVAFWNGPTPTNLSRSLLNNLNSTIHGPTVEPIEEGKAYTAVAVGKLAGLPTASLRWWEKDFTAPGNAAHARMRFVNAFPGALAGVDIYIAGELPANKVVDDLNYGFRSMGIEATAGNADLFIVTPTGVAPNVATDIYRGNMMTFAANTTYLVCVRSQIADEMKGTITTFVQQAPPP